MKKMNVKVVLGRGYISPFEIFNLKEGLVFTERDKTAFVMVENTVLAECFIKIVNGRLEVKISRFVEELEKIHRPHNRTNLEMFEYYIVPSSQKISVKKISNLKQGDKLIFDAMTTENNDLYCFIEVFSQNIAKGLTVFLKDEEEDCMLGVLVDEIYSVFDFSLSKPDFSGFLINAENEGYEVFSYDFSMPDVFSRDDLYTFYEMSELCCRSVNNMLSYDFFVKTDIVDQVLYSEIDSADSLKEIFKVRLDKKISTIDFIYKIKNKSLLQNMQNNFPYAWVNSLKNEFNIFDANKIVKSFNDKNEICIFFKLIFKDSDDCISIVMNANDFFEIM